MKKCVIIIDESMPVGVIANISAILGITVGKRRPDVVGCEINDADGNVHSGIIEFPVPVLKSDTESLKQLYAKLNEAVFEEVSVVDFTTLAQSCRTYDEYIKRMSDSSTSELDYIGIALIGDKKKINKLTGNMGLLR